MKAIKTTYHGPTNTRGSRITAREEDGKSVSIPYPHELNAEQAHQAAAKALCARLNWHGTMITGELKDCYVHVFATHDLESGRAYQVEAFKV